MTEYVLRTGRPALADLHEIHRLKEAGDYYQSGHPSAIWLGVPLTVEGRTFGVMAVQDQDNPTAFGAEEKRILEFVAGQTALAIERKRREEELQASTRLLQESEERFGKAFHFTPAPLSILRLADARLLEVNAVFLEVFGYTRSEVLERTLEELALWKDPERGNEFLRVVRRQGFVHSFEVRLQTKQRGEDIVLMSAHTIELNGEPCLLMLNVVVTERKRAEEELVRALAHERELSELKGRFVSLVSHEFRTPLGIIMSSAEILDAYLDRMSAAERQENVNDILQSTRHMVSLMEKVLLLGRSEAGRLTCDPIATSLGIACRRLVEEVASATHHRCPIRLVLPEDEPEAVLDESILRHIFTNLLDNAVKYSPAGSPVEFVVEARSPWAVLSVRDHGIGIPEADRRQLFQAFHRGSNVGSAPGSGLGMVIVKYCVQLHGGRIEVFSEVGVGTRFVVSLPLFSPPPSASVVEPKLAPLTSFITVP